MPLILVILDGMTECAARAEEPFLPQGCPTMERFAKQGGFGALENTPPGLSVDSVTCIATLLGVPAEEIPTGRAYLEALAAGIPVDAGDAVFRCNVTALDSSGALLGARGALREHEARALCEKFSGDGLALYHLGGYKNLLVAKGGAAQMGDVHTLPPHQNPGRALEDILPNGGPLAERLRELARRSRFWKDGVEYLLFPWDGAVPRALPGFARLHGKTAACVCKTEVVHGLCRALEIPVTVPPGATAEADTNLAEKARAALGLMERYDAAIIHVNGADELGHRRDAAGKAAFLRRADNELLAALAEGMPEGGRVLVCSDHATNAQSGRHEGGPQPFLLYEKGGTPLGPLGLHPGSRAVELLAGLM